MIKVLDVSVPRSGTMDALDEAIVASGADAYVAYASSDDADMRYLSGFKSGDPFIYFRKPRRRGVIIVSQMEHARAVRESGASVMTRAQAGLVEILKDEQDPWAVTARMIAGQVQGRLLVPPSFPLALARALEGFGEVIVDRDCLASMRAVKNRRQMAQIHHVQKVTEAAIGAGISLIRRSKVKKGILFSGAKPLTSEMVRAVMHNHLTAHGCTAKDTIVSCGKDSALPHCLGSGPLEAHQPIVLDIFPQDDRSGYFSDMTRTVSKGKPVAEVMEMHTAVCDAQALAISRMRAGVPGAGIHEEVVSFFAQRGYGSTTKGFLHNLGHGIGLQVHELPSLGAQGKPLAAGNVVTVEPGLYCPGIGGVRLEDIGAVTKKGFKNFTDFPTGMVV